MKKNFLNAILFGGLIALSAGSFVACSDYDDDIDGLQKQIDSVNTTLTALQTQVNAGKWVTSVTPTDGGFTIAFSDGTTYTVVNGKDGAAGKDGANGAAGKDGINGTNGKDGAAGKDGTKVTIGTDGYWYLDGEKTAYKAATDVKVPYAGTDGYWYFYDEDGNAVKSTYKLAGNTYAVKDANGVWTLNVPGADGTMQSIELPTAASKISSINILADQSGYTQTLTFYDAKFKYQGTTAWAGTKTLPADGTYIVASSDEMLVQITPGEVAGDVENFTFVNSKGEALGVKLAAEAYDGKVLTRAAASGLYVISAPMQEMTADEIKAINTAITSTSTSSSSAVAFGLAADGVLRSELATGSTGTSLSEMTSFAAPQFRLTSTSGWAGSGYSLGTAKVGQKYTLEVDNAYIYDSYFTIASQYVDVYGITYDDATRSFTIGKLPDVASTTGLEIPFTMTTVDVLGKVAKTNLSVTVAPSDSSSAIDLQTVDLTKKDKSFGFDLATVGVNTAFWKLNASLANTAYALYSDAACSSTKQITDYINLTGKILTAKDAETSDVNSAAKVSLTLTSTNGLKLNTTYYVKVDFKNSSSQVISTVVVPVQFTAPALADIFTPLEGYGKSDVINAYFATSGSTTLNLKDYFEEYVEDATAKLDSKETVVTIGTAKKTSKDLATLKGDNFEGYTIALASDEYTNAAATGGWVREYGYGEALTIKVTKDNYDGFKYATETAGEYSFQIRLASPIMSGTVEALSEIKLSYAELSTTDGAKILSSQIKGVDANGAKYNLFKEGVTPAYAKFGLDNTAPVTFGNGTYVVAAEGSEGAITSKADGYVCYKQNSDKTVSKTTADKITVTLKDAWGYEKTFEVPVTVVVP